MLTEENIYAIEKLKAYLNKPCKEYVPISNYEESLKTYLSKNNIVFISGLPGIGKTQLARHYIRNQYGKQYKEAGELNSYFSSRLAQDDGPLIPIINQLFSSDFASCYNENDYEDLWEILSRKDETTILLIDMPIIDHYFLDLIKYLSKILKLHIIITTISYVNPETYSVLFLQKPSFLDSKSIFEKNYNKSNSQESRSLPLTDHELSLLFTIFDYNPMIISLIARSLQNKNMYSLLKEQLPDTDKWLWKNYQLPRINCLYTNEVVITTRQKNHFQKQNTKKANTKYKLTLTKHATTLLYNYPKEIIVNYAPILCIWAGAPVSENFLTESTELTQGNIKTLLEIGLLEYTDRTNKFIKMNSLFYQIFWYYYSSSQNNAQYINPDFDKSNLINLNFFINHLKKIIKSYLRNTDENMGFFEVSNIIQTATCKIHYYLTSFTEDTNHKSKELDSYKWNIHLLDIIQFYFDRGNIEIAEIFIPKLFINTNKHGKETKRPTTFENSILKVFDLLKRMIGVNFNPSEDFDTLCSWLEEWNNSNTPLECQLREKFIKIIGDSLLCHYHRCIQMIYTYNQIYGSEINDEKLIEITRLFLKEIDSLFSNSESYTIYHKIALQCDLALCTNDLNILLDTADNYMPNKDIESEMELMIYLQILNCKIIFILESRFSSKKIGMLKEFLRKENSIIMEKFNSSMSYDTKFLYFTTRFNYMRFETFYFQTESNKEYQEIYRKYYSEMHLYKKIITEELSINSTNKIKFLKHISNFNRIPKPQHIHNPVT